MNTDIGKDIIRSQIIYNRNQRNIFEWISKKIGYRSKYLTNKCKIISKKYDKVLKTKILILTVIFINLFLIIKKII